MSKTNDISKEKQKLLQELKILQKKANARLGHVEQQFGRNMFAAGKLKEKLEEISPLAFKKGRVKFNEKMDEMQLKAIIKATKNYLKSETSTITGIKKHQANIKQGISIAFEDEETELTKDDVNTLFNFFEDRDFLDLTRFIKASDLIALLVDTKENNKTFDYFKEQIESYIFFGNDQDMIDNLQKIYDKFTK